MMVIGIIIRGSKGEVLASRQTPKIVYPDPVVAEASGIYAAVEFALELCFYRVIFEGDAKQVVDAFNQKEENGCRFGHLVHDCKMLLTRMQDWEYSRMMVVGIIIRDSKGEVLASRQTPKIFCPDPVVAEAWGIYAAVKFALELCFYRVIFEGDAKQVVDAFNQKEENGCRFGHLVHDFKMLLTRMQDWKVVHVKRIANQVAHCLAKSAASLTADLVHLESIPVQIQSIVADDVIQFDQ